MNIDIDFIELTRSIYDEAIIPTHRPVLNECEKRHVIEAIDSTYVSSVGEFVDKFEQQIAEFTGTKHAIATVNGTAALHIALQLAGVTPNTEVISPAIQFVAIGNVISYCQANPLFIDVDIDSMGLSPEALLAFLTNNTKVIDDKTYNKDTGRQITACVPMHTFGYPCRIIEIVDICNRFNIPVVEDAAESLGSSINNTHTGTLGLLGAFSFNGNKLITTGGGGMIVTNNTELANRAKHLTTTGKVPHPYQYVHDCVAYNYRMPNINAALGCAQMESLDHFLTQKRNIHQQYVEFFTQHRITMLQERSDCRANHWLNTVIFEHPQEKDRFIETTNQHDILTRPVWSLLNDLNMFKHHQHDGLKNSRWLAHRVVNLPSSVPI